MVKRIIFSLLVVVLASMSVTPFTYSSAVAEQISGAEVEYISTFTISAYYSPLPCQERYVTGSYAGDVRLNGSGVSGADGTPVYPGMIAAPREYAFGMKMHIPGVGITAVHDRGGAIKKYDGSNGVYDRLDVWMGYGDVGLERALQWGKRTLDVLVYGQNEGLSEEVTLGTYDLSESYYDCGKEKITLGEASAILAGASPSPSAAPVAAAPTGLGTLKLGDYGASVRELQKELTALNFYRGEITGNYGEVTEHAVYKFQQSQRLVGDADSLGAGVFGPKTFDRMSEIIASRGYNNNLVATVTEDYRIANSLIAFELDPGDIDDDVVILQEFLKEKGFFEGAFITDYYGPVTQAAVLKYQIANSIIVSAEDHGAGRVGPSTLAVINDLS